MPFAPTDISGIKLWLKQLGSADGTAVGTWTDSSGLGNDFTEATNKPTQKTNIVNGLSVVRFDGSALNQKLTGPNLMSGATAGEIFIVVKILNETPVGSVRNGLWEWSAPSGGGNGSYYPYEGDGIIYDNWGTNARKTTVNPTPALASWRLYNVSSASGAWTSRLDGTQLFTTATNTVSFNAAPLLGVGDLAATTRWFDGDIAEVIAYNSVLTALQRSWVQSYVAAKYALPSILVPSFIFPPRRTQRRHLINR